MEERGERVTKKLALDWTTLLPRRDDGPPPELEITTTTPAGAVERKQSSVAMGSDQQEHYLRSELSRMTDGELDDAIKGKMTSYHSVGKNLPDKGEKLLSMLKAYEVEKEHRKRSRLEKDNNGCAELKQSEKPEISGTSNGLRRDASPSVPPMLSTFTTNFSRKLEENVENNDSRTVNAFDKELSCMGFCDRRRNKQSLPKETSKNILSLRKAAFRCPTKLSGDVDKDIKSNSEQRGRPRRPCSPRYSDGKVSSFSKKRKESPLTPLKNLWRKSRNTPTVNLVDEEEDEEEVGPLDLIEKADELDECLKDMKIFYPSRDDQDPIEISYSDMDHLNPEAYLSSTIMNFYIRYLQLSTSTKMEICDFHFFNTYFYSKLVKAVSNKNDKESLFVKFRRWWKGVNIFDKAYILLPIHEHHHWSLIIICIPDKEDESGPVILHLDSLGLHSSQQIFDNVKSFLIEEWKYLQGESPTDHPFSDRIWGNLPRRIDHKTIQVPQQKNDYDCGLFVLFFIERFIIEVPQRLKRKDSSMFGNRWFKPEEASNLRIKIRDLIKDLNKASKEKKCDPADKPLPSVAPRGELMSQPIDC